jgi:hypothetical protein
VARRTQIAVMRMIVRRYPVIDIGLATVVVVADWDACKQRRDVVTTCDGHCHGHADVLGEDQENRHDQAEQPIFPFDGTTHLFIPDARSLADEFGAIPLSAACLARLGYEHNRAPRLRNPNV